jgi:hypothetical protein
MISVTGEITEQGELMVYGKDRLKDFYRQNKGERVSIRIEKCSLGETDSLLRFYYSVIIPQLQEAFKKTGTHMLQNKIDELLRNEYCGTVDEKFVDEFRILTKK